VSLTFADLPLRKETIDALHEHGFTSPFPIQEMVMPIALADGDVIGQAKTGTGKTLAFGIPVIERVIAPNDADWAQLPNQGKPQVLIVVPTRELCVQVTKDVEELSFNRGIRTLAVYGGRAFEPQIEALNNGVEIVVGTPGRLLDLYRQGQLTLKFVSRVVLDEADEMLDLGFLPDVEKIFTSTPARQQTMLFSATMPGDIIALARRFMNQPVHIRTQDNEDEGAVVSRIEQHVVRAHAMDKIEMLARMKALNDFKAGKSDVLIATDVAARGIDIDGITHVINYQCPEDEKTYVHRIGRTARAGAAGIAVTFVDWDELARWKMIDTALVLGLPEPVETYSSSEHLFEMLNIPAGSSGRMNKKSATPVDKPKSDRPKTDRPKSEKAVEPRKPAADRIKRERTRTKRIAE